MMSHGFQVVQDVVHPQHYLHQHSSTTSCSHVQNPKYCPRISGGGGGGGCWHGLMGVVQVQPPAGAVQGCHQAARTQAQWPAKGRFLKQHGFHLLKNTPGPSNSGGEKQTKWKLQFLSGGRRSRFILSLVGFKAKSMTTGNMLICCRVCKQMEHCQTGRRDLFALRASRPTNYSCTAFPFRNSRFCIIFWVGIVCGSFPLGFLMPASSGHREYG